MSAHEFYKNAVLAKSCLEEFFFDNLIQYSSPSISEYLTRFKLNDKTQEVLENKKRH